MSLDFLTVTEEKHLQYNSKYYLLTRNIASSDKLISDGKKIYQLITQKNMFGVKLYNTIAIDSNETIFDRFIPFKHIKAVYDYAALKIEEEEANEFNYLFDLGLLSHVTVAIDFANKYSQLHTLLQQLYEEVNSKEYDQAIALMKYNTYLLGDTNNSADIIKMIDSYKDQLQIVEYCKTNIDSLHFLASSNIDTNIRYHMIDKKGFVIKPNKKAIKKLVYIFIKQCYYQRKALNSVKLS